MPWLSPQNRPWCGHQGSGTGACGPGPAPWLPWLLQTALSPADKHPFQYSQHLSTDVTQTRQTEVGLSVGSSLLETLFCTFGSLSRITGVYWVNLLTPAWTEGMMTRSRTFLLECCSSPGGSQAFSKMLS